MKRIALVAMMLLGFATSALAKPVYLAAPAKVDATPVVVNGKEYLRYTICAQDSADLWMSSVVNFCADKLREGCDENLPSSYTSSDGKTRTWDVPMEVIRRGQSGMNFAHDANWFDTLWLGLPDSKVQVGSNLVCARSVKDKDIPHSGGTYLLYKGPGAPYVPAPGALGIDDRPIIVPCGGGQETVVKHAPAPKPTVYPRKQVTRKVPCPDGKGICSQPCIVEIRDGVEHLVESVGTWTKDEPVEERTLQQKARITLDSLGKPDKTDAPDEKTVQQKTRKTLKHVKKIDKNLGESKKGRSVHDKLGESGRKGGTLFGTAEKTHEDVKWIRNHLEEEAKKAGKPVQDLTCIKCHSDTEK